MTFKSVCIGKYVGSAGSRLALRDGARYALVSVHVYVRVLSTWLTWQPLQLRAITPQTCTGSIRTAQLRLWTIPRDPSRPILLALGPKVSKYYLHWGIWAPREWVVAQRGSYSRLATADGVMT